MTGPPRTSLTHPIRVDWLSTPWPGRVGLTFAPGKKHSSRFSGVWNRDLEADVQRIRDHYRADHLVCLLQDDELEAFGIAGLERTARSTGLAFHRLRITDGDIPPNSGAVSELVTEVVEWARSGQNVVIHCRGGLGRAGTIGGCVLRAAGLSPEETLADLARARGPGCPETEAQRRFISGFGLAVAGA